MRGLGPSGAIGSCSGWATRWTRSTTAPRVSSRSSASPARDLPFGVLVEALDEHLGSLTATQLSGLDPEHEAHLAAIFPAFARRAAGAPVLAAERYRSHPALLDLLDRLALSRPLALLLDDVHAADPATLEFCPALLRQALVGSERDAVDHALGAAWATIQDGRLTPGGPSCFVGP
jgi:hypothetical protein